MVRRRHGGDPGRSGLSKRAGCDSTPLFDPDDSSQVEPVLQLIEAPGYSSLTDDKRRMKVRRLEQLTVREADGGYTALKAFITIN